MTKTGLIKLSVGAVVFRGEEVLLIKRAQPPFQGHWSIPGGKVEYGESLEQALMREVREETGVDIKIIGLIDVFESLPQDIDVPHFVMIDYVCDWIEGTPVAGDDAAEAVFVPFGEALSRLAWDQTRRALQQAKLAYQKSKPA